MKRFVYLGALLALASGAWAQSAGGAATIQKLELFEDKGGVRVEVTLTSSVSPRVSWASKPERLMLDLPGTLPGNAPSSVPFNHNGVKSVQVERENGSTPSSTRVVVVLESQRPYGVASDGNKIIVSILPAVENATSDKKRLGPASAASVPLITRIHRKPEEANQTSSVETQSAQTPAPPPSLPPIAFPPEQEAASAGASPASGAANQAGQNAAPAPNGSNVSSAASGNATVSPDQTVPGSAPVDGSESPAKTEAAGSNPAIVPAQANPDVRIAFRVKYVAEGVAYLEGGRNEGLTEGMKLEVKAIDPSQKATAASDADALPIAELQLASAALSSAVGEIHNPTRPIKVGDWAYLTSEETQSLIAQRSLSATRKYPVVVSFSEGDTLDDEARVVIPRPPLPEINRARGRIGFDYSGVASHDNGGGVSSNAGLMIRTDITRINGTYWNLTGFWRGRINNQSHGGQATLQDLINRTYTIGMTYDNPNSKNVAGFGRLYLPWATSLDSIDGGYFARRLTQGVTAGIFAGSTPDPTSWNYNPDRRIGGAFVNFEGGSFDNFRYTSTSGMGIALLKWNIDRPFVFFENGIFYKRYLSIYDSLQVDSPSGNPQVASPGAGVSRNFLTVRLQPTSRLEFDVNQTYFRDIPTYNAQLVGTGLLDKYLFQGFSGGARVQVVKDVWAYTLLGRSNRSGDAKSSLNQLYGVTVGRMPWIGMRTDVHYSKFNSSFGSGSYESISLSRNFNENLRWEVLGGRQSFVSPTTSDISHFVTGNFEAALGPHYFVQTGYTWNRGAGQNYDQWLFTFGYRFDSRSKGR
ncbi:MAG: hypothetical protein DMG83_20735 [Acidobacteria bacterium]|nr:MAG: hypothetical protein DMG83_20735 [Acidobacteriota bacterium]